MTSYLYYTVNLLGLKPLAAESHTTKKNMQKRPIDLPWVGPIHHVLYGRAHWRQLANTVERLGTVMVSSGSVISGGDAACTQITLGNVFNT